MRRGSRFTGAHRYLHGLPKPAAPGPPVVTNPGTQVSRVGTPDELAIEAELATSYTATGLPAGMLLNGATGQITGTPTTVETVTTKLTATGPGGSTSTSWEWRVEEAVAPPVEPEGSMGPPPEYFGSVFAEEAYEAMEPMAVGDASNGLPLAALCDAVGSMFLQVEEAVRAREGHDAQTQTFDINRTPAFLVPFVAQAAGVKVTVGLSTTAQRGQVLEEKQWKRGKLDQITAALQETLTGARKVRYTMVSAWQLEVFTEAAQTPNTTATEAAGRGAKPGGIVMSFALSTVPTIDQGTRTIDGAAGKIDTAILANIT